MSLGYFLLEQFDIIVTVSPEALQTIVTDTEALKGHGRKFFFSLTIFFSHFFLFTGTGTVSASVRSSSDKLPVNWNVEIVRTVIHKLKDTASVAVNLSFCQVSWMWKRELRKTLASLHTHIHLAHLAHLAHPGQAREQLFTTTQGLILLNTSY